MAVVSCPRTQGRVSERIAEQIEVVAVPQTVEDMTEVIEFMEPITEVVKLTPQERVQNRTVDQIVGLGVRRIREELVQVI